MIEREGYTAICERQYVELKEEKKKNNALTARLDILLEVSTKEKKKAIEYDLLKVQYDLLKKQAQACERERRALVLALGTIINHNTLGGEKYNNYQNAYFGVINYATKRLNEIKKGIYAKKNQSTSRLRGKPNGN